MKPANQFSSLEKTINREATDDSTSQFKLKRKRGITTGKGFIEMISTNGNKRVEVVFNQELWVPNNPATNKKFTTSIGIEVRSRAPVCNKGWHEIDDDIKRQLREGLTVHYVVNLDHPNVILYINDRMRTAYTQFKWKLHQHYLKCGTTVHGRATLPPLRKNADSRKVQQGTHRGGAMPFIQHTLIAAQEGNPLSFIENWGKMYQDSKGNWVNDAANEKFVRKVEEKKKLLKDKLALEAPEGSDPETIEVSPQEEISIMADECGRKGRRVRGLGSFPRLEIPTNSASSNVQVNLEVTSLRENVENLTSTVNSLASQNTKFMEIIAVLFKKLPQEGTSFTNAAKMMNEVYDNSGDRDGDDQDNEVYEENDEAYEDEL
ncbi:hypothetical protein OROHE_000836 [Orobanche hederae]